MSRRLTRHFDEPRLGSWSPLFKWEIAMSRTSASSDVANPAAAAIPVVIGDTETSPNANEHDVQKKLQLLDHSELVRFISVIGQIHRMSEQLFPGPVTMEYSSDPEDPTHESIVFDVVARGAFSDYKDLFFQWHDEVAKLCPGTLSEFKLIVHPKP
jgi:hypothetical protein